MTETLNLLPAAALRTQLQGLAALGLDMQRIRDHVGPVPEASDALVTRQQYLAMWSQAHALYRQPGLPTALAAAIPFGALGVFDYLAGSAATVSGCCESAVSYFRMVTSDTRLAIDVPDDGCHVVRVDGETGLSSDALEFTLALLVSRARYMTDGRCQPSRIRLPVKKPEQDPVRERLLGSVLEYDFPGAEILIDATNWHLECKTADSYLHTALKQISSQFRGAEAGGSSLEQALRARLRGALAQGRNDSARIAAMLGLSERTMQRRLRDAGRSLAQIVEDFRREESARLLCDPALPLVEVAARLGYAEQTSFTRAFRRWTGTTPRDWRETRSKTASPG